MRSSARYSNKEEKKEENRREGRDESPQTDGRVSLALFLRAFLLERATGERERERERRLLTGGA